MLHNAPGNSGSESLEPRTIQNRFSHRLLARLLGWGSLCVAVAALAALFLVPREWFAGPRPRLAIQLPAGVARLPAIRVALTSAAVRSAKIAVNGEVRLRVVGQRTPLATLPSLSEASVQLSATGFRLGGRTWNAPRLELDPGPEGTVWVNDHAYRGVIRLVRTVPDQFWPINVVPLEDYVASVVDGEMPREFGTEARKAQAIVARTYALAQMQQTPREAPYDLFASTRSQKYLGVKYKTDDGRLLAGESADSREVALATAGMVCTARGRLFCTYYSAVCGGRTSEGTDFFEDAGSVQNSVPCTWCAEAPLYRWQVELTAAELQAKLKAAASDVPAQFGTLQSVHIIPEPHPGGVATVVLGDGRLEHKILATSFRRLIGTDKFYSHHFQVQKRGESWVFLGAGHGHGVGLCQWGARGQAKVGRNGLQILGTYYPEAVVVQLVD